MERDHNPLNILLYRSALFCSRKTLGLLKCLTIMILCRKRHLKIFTLSDNGFWRFDLFRFSIIR